MELVVVVAAAKKQDGDNNKMSHVTSGSLLWPLELSEEGFCIVERMNDCLTYSPTANDWGHIEVIYYFLLLLYIFLFHQMFTRD